jgi:hypothetical protein
MSHTPGPWKCGENEPFVYALNGAGTNRFFLTVQPGWLAQSRNEPWDPRTSHEEIMANARLITAAPELLVVLMHRVLEDHEQEDGRVLVHCGLCKQYDNHLDTCLIAKAGGA